MPSALSGRRSGSILALQIAQTELQTNVRRQIGPAQQFHQIIASRMQEFDFVIVGMGLAGACLASELRRNGSRVLVIDQSHSNTASRIAAGLITPVTGQRFAISWNFETLWTTARQFYHELEKVTETHFLSIRPSIRLFRDADERATFRQRCEDPGFQRFITDQEIQPARVANGMFAPHGGFEMTPSARLLVNVFLDAITELLRVEGAYLHAELRPSDIRLDQARKVRLDRFQTRASKLILCTGTCRSPVSCPEVNLQPAKGEVLTVRIAGFNQSQVVHQQIWLAPTEDQTYRVGATFDPDPPHSLPSDAGRKQLLEQLHRFVSLPAEVEGHQAGLRPIVDGRLPIVGLTDQDPRIGFFNGLGAKGALRAPWVASKFTQFLLNDQPLPADITPRRDGSSSSPIPTMRLTDLAHQSIKPILRPGDVAIDATAGNGNDTQFLAECVGAEGYVFALDLQSEAIRRTKSRLKAAGLTNVRLLQDSHNRLSVLIPREHHGNIAAITMNLGYLPRGDKTITTHPNSTCQAIRQGIAMLRQGGLMTIVAYTGHPGGRLEAEAVKDELGMIGGRFQVDWPGAPAKGNSPLLFIVRHSGE